MEMGLGRSRRQKATWMRMEDGGHPLTSQPLRAERSPPLAIGEVFATLPEWSRAARVVYAITPTPNSASCVV
eukprot:scaffold4151_cov25-Tisochrysis_lutea.AAC.2